jgi:c-di-GMP-binding flagellar brake protein YcgR
MTIERRQDKRHPCTSRIGIFLAKGEHAVQETNILSGNLIDISLHGAGMSLPQILDKRVHLAYAAMESKELILHIVFHLQSSDSM